MRRGLRWGSGRGAAERLAVGGWFVVAGSAPTLGLVALAWFRSRSRQLGAAAAFLATPLVIWHANQHEFVLAPLGILLAVAAVPELRTRLATLAIGLHAVLWSGLVLDAQASAWLLFGVQLGWLIIVVWMSGLDQPSRRLAGKRAVLPSGSGA